VFNEDEQSEILNAVGQAVSETLAVTFGRPIEVRLGPPQSNAADAVLVIATEAPPRRFHVQVKGSMTPATVAAIAARHPPNDLMLFTPRLTPAVIGTCRNFGVNCADADGNLFVRTGSSAVDIQGRPAQASRQFESSVNTAARLTNRSGLQILFVLLAAPELRNEPLRTIARAAETSVGSAAGMVQELAQRRYLAMTSKGRSLRRTRELFDIWVEGYQARLYPRLRMGTFATDTDEWWRTSKGLARELGAQWGGETAIWVRGLDLRPARGVLYVEEIPSALITTLRLRRDRQPEAPVELRRRFWDIPALSSADTVPAPLIYADLLAHGDPRLAEAAALLRRTDEQLCQIDGS
jgi:hypothetical protein